MQEPIRRVRFGDIDEIGIYDAGDGGLLLIYFDSQNDGTFEFPVEGALPLADALREIAGQKVTSDAPQVTLTREQWEEVLWRLESIREDRDSNDADRAKTQTLVDTIKAQLGKMTGARITGQAAFSPGDEVGCHRGLYERPGVIIGPGGCTGTYSVDIVGLGTMDVSVDQLRLIATMNAAERDWIEKVRRHASQ